MSGMMRYFNYGDTEINYLKRRDDQLGRAITEMGMIRRKVTPDPFTALVKAVISQQISTKAAETVTAGMTQSIGQPFDPQSILGIGLDAIRSFGMSERKAGYIMGIAQAALDGRIDFHGLRDLTDDEVMRQLTNLKGVGVWTAEMVLIFSLEREDVVSYTDLGIRRGMQRLYRLDSLSEEQFTAFARRYSPYGSVASLYLWHIAGQRAPSLP